MQTQPYGRVFDFALHPSLLLICDKMFAVCQMRTKAALPIERSAFLYVIQQIGGVLRQVCYHIVFIMVYYKYLNVATN